jgi:hypothetical protein
LTRTNEDVVIAPNVTSTATAIAMGIAHCRDGFHHCRGNFNRRNANRDHRDDFGTCSMNSDSSPG